jgi:RNA recognition motif-containing protein
MAAMGLPHEDDDTPPNTARRPNQHAATITNPEGFLAAAAASPQSAFNSLPPSQGLAAKDHSPTINDDSELADLDLPPPPDMQEGEEPLTDLEKSNLYVSNISTEVTDDGLRDMFAQFGAILNSRIMVDIHTCKSRGFGFVQFSKPNEAAKAVRAMDGSVHHSQTLMVRLASRKTRQPGALTSKMFLRNVPAGVSEDELRRLCTRFGPVTTCAVRPDVQHGIVTDDTTGGVSQVAYITFADVDTTKRTSIALNNSKPWPTSIHPLLAKVLDSNQKRRTKEDEANATPGSLRTGSPRLDGRNGRTSATPLSMGSVPTGVALTHSGPIASSPGGPGVVVGAMHPQPQQMVQPGPQTMMQQHQQQQQQHQQHQQQQQQQHQQFMYHHHHHQQHMHHHHHAAQMVYQSPAAYSSPHMNPYVASPHQAFMTSQPMPTHYSPHLAYSAQPMYPTAAQAAGPAPPGYQLVMQPTLQPMYVPTHPQTPPVGQPMNAVAGGYYSPQWGAPLPAHVPMQIPTPHQTPNAFGTPAGAFGTPGGTMGHMAQSPYAQR